MTPSEHVTHSIGNVSDLVAAIVEKNPGRFRLDSNEVIQRRYFIQSTRDEIADIKDKVQIQMRGRDVDHTARKVKFLATSCTSVVHRVVSRVQRDLVWKVYVAFSFDENIYREGITPVQKIRFLKVKLG